MKEKEEIIIEVIRIFGNIDLGEILKNIILKEGSLDV